MNFKIPKNQYLNPLNRNPRKTFSQYDEDGITIEILERIAIGVEPTFLEIGVGNGLENNTLLLAALGWQGNWIGNENLHPDLKIGKRIKFTNKQVDTRFIQQELIKLINETSTNQPDLISIDVDSLDYQFVQEILRIGILPKVFIVEYNASFVPPVVYIRKNEENNSWKGDNEFGASLQAWKTLLGKNGYKLVACNRSGVNAYFVSLDLAGKFTDISNDILDIYIPPDYGMKFDTGHKMSIKVINQLLEDSTDD